ncbi:hypothetical protein EV688_11456 [Chromatocurvus halotolerans]|uniref:Plasmid stabilization system protein ParE n=1 Tax=Chromatocurvus halotolerans TaxID=1132028 RepID=A0A4R2KKZ5_9GAMM|nr:hypothetical protein EV688_11456 [Chromatocurvus halotolerans]
MTYEFHPWAEAEFLEAVAYYESRVSELGTQLIQEFEALSSLISEEPTGWRIVRQPDIRRAPLRRFPFCIIYRAKPGLLDILAFAHNSRRPQYWIDRR